MNPSRRAFLAAIGGTSSQLASGCLDGITAEATGDLEIEWVSDTGVAYDGNHHRLATTLVDDEPIISIPRSDVDGSVHCGLVALDASGDVRWSAPLPPEHCEVHAIGDVSAGDLTGDGRPAFLTFAKPGQVVGYDAATGEETFRESLGDSIGYSPPVVVTLGDDTPRVLATDFAGTLAVFAPDGSVEWDAELAQPVFVAPLVADFTGTGDRNVAVRHGSRPNTVTCFTADGSVAWEQTLAADSLSWSLADTVAGPAIVATAHREVVSLRGRDGRQAWSIDLDDDLRDVHVGAVGDGMAVLTGVDGVARGIDVTEGTIEWSTAVAGERIRMPPPVRGAVTSPQSKDVVTTTYDGTVAVLDGSTGDLLARTDLNVGLFAPAHTIDVTGNGRDEIVLGYGDARVATLSYHPG